ncbi:MAG: isochorismatase family protein, partial [Longicatena sp.]
GYPIINFRDSHPANANEFNAFPSHCLENSSESEMIHQLKPYEKEMITLLKNSTNGFMQPMFLDTFKNLDCDEYICVGCCTDICVLQFSLSLQSYINQNDLPVTVTVIDDCVETFNLPGHDQKEFGQMALAIMQGAGIRRVSSLREL